MHNCKENWLTPWKAIIATNDIVTIYGCVSHQVIWMQDQDYFPPHTKDNIDKDELNEMLSTLPDLKTTKRLSQFI